MKRNMKQWVTDYINAPTKKAMPILSFPGVQLIGHTVEELVRSGELQAQCMKAIADRFDTGVAFSLIDLSVEAEAFGDNVGDGLVSLFGPSLGLNGVWPCFLKKGEYFPRSHNLPV